MKSKQRRSTTSSFSRRPWYVPAGWQKAASRAGQMDKIWTFIYRYDDIVYSMHRTQ